jgi:hypothetical protein
LQEVVPRFHFMYRFILQISKIQTSLGKGFGIWSSLALEHYLSGMTIVIHSLIVNKAKVATDAAH